VIAVVLVWNLPALGTIVAGGFGFLAGHLGGLSDGWAFVVGCATLTASGFALEVHPNDNLRPRLFWVVPSWFTGLVLGGGALLELGRAEAGYVTLGVAGIVVIALVARAIAGKPGGRWMAGLVGALAVVTAFQLVGYYRPEWKHPVLYAVNAIALVAAIVCGVMVHRARREASSHTDSTTR
jgi:hypothetical protein